MVWGGAGDPKADPEQRVLVSEPYRRLSYTWHTFTPEWAKATGIDDEVLATIREEPRSKVTFDIEPHGELVKLTVVHDDFEPGSTVLSMVSEGWPRLLSDLIPACDTWPASRMKSLTFSVTTQRLFAERPGQYVRI
jgi:uncharacterized protein YndB with AHSA1/START domain